MRHRKLKLQFNRFTSWRKATLKSLVKSLLRYQSIKTTLARAKATKPLIDKLIGLTKENSLIQKRRAYDILGDHKLVTLLFEDIGMRFKEKTSGFSRIINLGSRRGDNAKLAILELTEIKKKESKAKKERKEIKKESALKETTEAPSEKVSEEKKAEAQVAIKEKPPTTKKPSKKFLGGLRNIFKKERDAL